MSGTEVITEPSICIPRTLNNTTWRDVKNTFEGILGTGTVERVDIVPSRNNDPFCKIFIHFRYWPTCSENYPIAVELRERLMNGETLNVVYDTPWFWKCSASRLPKPQRLNNKGRPYIDFHNKDDRARSPPLITRQTGHIDDKNTGTNVEEYSDS